MSNKLNTTKKMKNPIKLSRTEFKVLVLMEKGLKSKDIRKRILTKGNRASDERSISTYKLRIKRKLGLSRDVNEYAVVATAIEKNII
jgi:DNA-binding CsgD family transcriptional regulator